MLTNLLRVLFLAPPCYVFISLVKGWIIVSGCIRAGGISMTSPMNRRSVDDFCKKAFDKGQYKASCPCSKCEIKSDETQLTMGKHIITYGFVANYTRWIIHGEAHRARDEVLRQRIEEFDDEVRCGDMLEDFHQANFDEGPDHVMKEAPEPTAKAYYDMLSSA
jgi:hypothetical protein